jgi:CubicO group peptidase (beta-lactamase class C family)
MDEGTFDRVVESLDEARSEGLRMRSLLVCGPEGRFVHDFAPGRPPAVDVRSISKVVVALAVGVAIADGVRLRGRSLSLDLPVWPYFPDHLHRQPVTGRAHLRAVRLRHLLTSTIGHTEGFLFRADLQGRDRATLLDHVFARQLDHPPGTHFAYSNVGWYLISAMVTDELGVSLRDWVGGLLLDRLGITGARWVTYGRYAAGGTGLALSAVDLERIGRLFLDGGRHRGRPLVPRAWIEAMRSPAVRTGRDDDLGATWRPTSYGYGLWICDSGVHYCDGTGGQFLIIVPRTGTVVVALAEAGDTAIVARCLDGAL